MKKYLLIVLICLISGISPDFAQAQTPPDDTLFSVFDVRVDETADSALAAREAAFAAGQRQGFKMLLQRLLTPEQQAGIVMPEPAVIQTLIQNFEVADERLSSTRYVATLNFQFAPEPVRAFLANHGQMVARTARAVPVLVLPFLQVDGKIILWEDPNPWRAAWMRKTDLGSAVPVRVPLGDIADLNDIPDQSALQNSQAGVQNMIARYAADDIVVAKAEAGKVHIYRFDGNGFTRHQTLEISGTGTAFYDAGVRAVVAHLQQGWQASIATVDQDQARVLLSARFQNLRDWIEIQNRLRALNGVTDMKVVALSQRNARIDLIFNGDIKRLSAALAHQGLQLGLPVENPDDFSAPPVYDLDLAPAPTLVPEPAPEPEPAPTP